MPIMSPWLIYFFITFGKIFTVLSVIAGIFLVIVGVVLLIEFLIMLFEDYNFSEMPVMSIKIFK